MILFISLQRSLILTVLVAPHSKASSSFVLTSSRVTCGRCGLSRASRSILCWSSAPWPYFNAFAFWSSQRVIRLTTERRATDSSTSLRRALPSSKLFLLTSSSRALRWLRYHWRILPRRTAWSSRQCLVADFWTQIRPGKWSVALFSCFIRIQCLLECPVGRSMGLSCSFGHGGCRCSCRFLVRTCYRTRRWRPPWLLCSRLPVWWGLCL